MPLIKESFPNEEEITGLLKQLLPLVQEAYWSLQLKEQQLVKYQELRDAIVDCRRARIALNRQAIKEEQLAIKLEIDTADDYKEIYDVPDSTLSNLQDELQAAEVGVNNIRLALFNGDPALRKSPNLRKLLGQIETLLETK